MIVLWVALLSQKLLGVRPFLNQMKKKHIISIGHLFSESLGEYTNLDKFGHFLDIINK